SSPPVPEPAGPSSLGHPGHADMPMAHTSPHSPNALPSSRHGFERTLARQSRSPTEPSYASATEQTTANRPMPFERRSILRTPVNRRCQLSPLPSPRPTSLRSSPPRQRHGPV